MFRKKNNRKGQNTAEYAILISLVVAGIIAMQTYAQRALQGRVQAASTLLSDQGTTATEPGWVLNNIRQYEPYYLESNYEIDKTGIEAQRLIQGVDNAITTEERMTRTRAQGGFQRSNYNTQVFSEAF
jgi:Flp pilus assembly pilin Flp